MDRNFDNRDFERFVQQNADQYRMFPSDKVWKGIHNALHTRRRWYGIGLALLILTTATVTVVMLTPGERNGKLGYAIGNSTINSSALSTPGAKEPAVAVIAPARTNSNTGFVKNYPTVLQPAFMKEVVTKTTPDEYNYDGYDGTIVSVTPDISNVPPVTEHAIDQDKNVIVRNNLAPGKPVTPTTLPVITNNKESASVTISDKKEENKDVVAREELSRKNELIVPFTIESVVNSYKYKANRKKLSWQLYLTPTISYRSLTENTEFISAARYNSIMNGGGGSPVFYSTDVNSVVNHKPDVGFQVGLRTAYPVSKWFSITGGLQLGVSKYDIQAYKHTTEVATIELSTARAGVRSVSAMTNYRNGPGAKENWLRNFYFTAAIPIGVELKLSDGSRNYFGIGTTLQPTYVLDNRAYLISTDYKNYAEVPSLTRRWNLNTSFEVFSAHTTGKVKWRIGPQIHYQVMSSFIKNYPIKEHLFDFGLKLGVNLR